MSDDIKQQASPSASTGLPSIRSRLAHALTAWSVAWGLAVGAAVWLAATDEVDELLDDALQSSGELLADLIAMDDEAGPARRVVTAGHGKGVERFAWQVVLRDGKVSLRSQQAPEAAWRLAPTPGFSDVADWRVHGRAMGAAGSTLYVAQTRAERHEARFDVAFRAVLAALAVGLLGHIWLRSRIRSELRPLQTLAQRLDAWDPGAQGALQAGALGTPERRELLPVHRAMTSATGRLASRLANEQAFSAHAAHALRTPLAGIDAQLAVVLRDCPSPWRERVQRARDAAARLQGVVAALLGLFRSGVELQPTEVNLHELVQRLPAPQLRIDVAAGASVRADPDLLAAALVNLIDNAHRHGAGRVLIDVVDGATLVVQDDGPGIDAARRNLLQGAIDAQRYEGVTGLGLMLADRVARAHGGGLTLMASPAGFAVSLRLAATPHPAAAAQAATA